jgi:hypothetical protein
MGGSVFAMPVMEILEAIRRECRKGEVFTIEEAMNQV